MNDFAFYIGLLVILKITNGECTNKKDKDCEDLIKLENAIRQKQTKYRKIFNTFFQKG